MTDKHIDEISGTDTTGHEWDGIRELNTPLPRWWLWTFYATVIWAVGYMIVYPAVPLINEATKGIWNYSSRADLAAQMTSAEQARSATLEQIRAKSLEEIRSDADLNQFAVAGGASAYRVNCVQCHGTGAQGGGGYPNLNDDDWLWGGSLEAIHTTIANGIRFSGNDDTRTSEMPAFGRDELLEGEQIRDTAEYVLKLSGQEHDAAAAERGATVYAENCAACHADSGTGDREQGAPNLTDAIWFYGGDRDQLVRQISNPRHGVMPAWSHRLDEATIKQLAIYIHSLGGGE